MEITRDIKQRIIEAIKANRENYPSDNKHAAVLGISGSVYNSIKKGNINRQVSDTNWICIARRLNVSLSYVDCSQVKSKQRLIRYIAHEFGISTNGRYVDVYDDLVFYLKTLEAPLVILDEAGDLQYEAFLELKALWNATERCCAPSLASLSPYKHVSGFPLSGSPPL